MDQIGSVRRVFASTTSASAFGYDAYGNALQSAAPLTDFNYAGMFYNADSGLYLTKYRAYDPVAGRWLSRDPLGEQGDAVANLYRYVRGNPVSLKDPLGLWTFQIGGTVNFQFGPIAFTFDAGFAFDGQGNFGTYYSAPLVGGGVGDDLSGGLSFKYSQTASTVCDLRGPFGNASVGGGAGPHGSADYFWGATDDGRAITGAGVTLGGGLGGGASVTGTVTGVSVWGQL